MAFLELNDGSCQQNLQAVVKAEVYEELGRLTPKGTFVLLEGVLGAFDGAKHEQLIELRVERVLDVDARACPLAKKTRVTLEGLTDLVHLRPRTDKLPWIVLLEGGLIAPPDGRVEYPASILGNAICVGSTNDWLLLGIDQQRQMRERGKPSSFDSYVLHNPFSLEYVPLPELGRSPPPRAQYQQVPDALYHP
jgi:hypothetical protein